MKSYRDIQGDGGSRILEQVIDQRDRVEQRLAGVRRRLAVASGKGGVGKSTVTMQLAAALAARGERVAILDLDINGPSQARLGGVQGRPPIPAAEGLIPPRTAAGIGVVSLGSLVPESAAVEFDSVSEGDSHTWRATREFAAMTELLMAVHWGELDTLLFDLPPGAERTLQFAEYLGAETAFLLVTIPSELSRGVVQRSIAALAGVKNPLLGYVENMAGYYCADCDAVKPLFPEGAGDAPHLELPCLGRVPFDPALAAACDAGEPAPSPALDRIAGVVAAALEESR